MQLLIFVIGMQGSGKTTLLDNVSSDPRFRILKPSTNRPRRSAEENEYFFVDKWENSEYAWSIERNGYKYGMSKDELYKTDKSKIAITVFDPGSYQDLEDFRSDYDGIAHTFGLDTIDSVQSQHIRVDNEPTRKISDPDFFRQKSVIESCDSVVSGDEAAVFGALHAVVDVAIGKGGILCGSQIQPMLQANLLLKNVSNDSEPASYDLSLGEDVWCQGKFLRLSDDEPTLKIPAYSYAIVSAREIANLPSFVCARFDVKNSLFFRGVILSNGPQVDPGYRGALFCMLYNGSDQSVGLTKGQHFATIEFITTTGFDKGYKAKYQGKERLTDFMSADVMVSEGGRILERTENKIEKLQREWVISRGVLIGVLAFVLSPLVLIYWNIFPFLGNAEVIAELQNKNRQLEERVEFLEKKSDDVTAAAPETGITRRIQGRDNSPIEAQPERQLE